MPTGITLGKGRACGDAAFCCFCAIGAIALRASNCSHAFASSWHKSLTVWRHCFIASAWAFIARWCAVSIPSTEPKASAAPATIPLGGVGTLGAGGSLTRWGKAFAARTAP